MKVGNKVLDCGKGGQLEEQGPGRARARYGAERWARDRARRWARGGAGRGLGSGPSARLGTGPSRARDQAGRGLGTGPGVGRGTGLGAGQGAGPGTDYPPEPGGAGGAGARGAGPRGAGVGGTGAGGAGAAGAGAVDPGAGGASGTSQPPLQPASPLPAPSPDTERSRGLTERREPTSCSVSPVCTARLAPHSRPPPVPGTHAMALRPSSIPLRVPLPAPPESSLHEVPDPESDRARAAGPTVSHLLATTVTDPSIESAAASALVAELLDFAAAYRLDYASHLVAESASASPPSVEGECALSTDVLEDRQEEFECLAAAVPRFASMLLAPEGAPDAPDIPTPRSCTEAITGPYSSQWQAAMDVEMASSKSTGTYVGEVPPPGANIVDGMWIFRVKRLPGSPPSFKARYVARGFSQRQGVDYFHTISPTSKMTTLRVLLHVAAQRDYELHSLDFSTAFLQSSLHEEIWLRRPPDFTETTLAALWFAPATVDPSLFLRTDTSLLLFYVLVYVDDLVFATADTEALTLVKSELQKRHTCIDLEPSGPYPELVGCLMYLMTTSGMGLVHGGRRPVVLTSHADASWLPLLFLTESPPVSPSRSPSPPLSPSHSLSPSRSRSDPPFPVDTAICSPFPSPSHFPLPFVLIASAICSPSSPPLQIATANCSPIPSPS
ncbi:unnamed protein product [Closterium sp. NIES-53]